MQLSTGYSQALGWAQGDEEMRLVSSMWSHSPVSTRPQKTEFQMVRCVTEDRLRCTSDSDFAGLTLDSMLRGGLFKCPRKVLLTEK